MTKPTLNDGDVWSESLANGSIRPYVATDPSVDEIGSIPPLFDNQLSSEPGNIKSNFYTWYRRCELTVGSGLLLDYSAFGVMLTNGTVVAKPAGSIAAVNNATRFVYIDTAGNVTVGESLPSEGVPLAIVEATAGEVSSLVDLRYQEVEQVRPLSQPSATGLFSVGDMKFTARANLEPGWLECNGQSLSAALYPDLFGAIGYAYGGSGANFNVPDMRGRGGIGAGQGTGLSNRVRGQTGGTERHTLSLGEIPSHNHGVSDPGHTHSFSDPGHAHAINDPAHAHAVFDPGHEHSLLYKRSITSSQNINEGGAELSQAVGDRPIPNTSRNTTGIAVQGAFTGISVRAAGTGASIGAAGTGVTVAANGGGAPHENMSPFTVGRWVIKTS